jgi:hypothetical protein
MNILIPVMIIPQKPAFYLSPVHMIVDLHLLSSCQNGNMRCSGLSYPDGAVGRKIDTDDHLVARACVCYVVKRVVLVDGGKR